MILILIISILLLLIIYILLSTNTQKNYKKEVNGKVIRGLKLGKKLFDYPTANIYNTINLPKGMYLADSNFGDCICMVFHENIIECHIKNFNKDIYGKTLQLKNIKNIEEVKHVYKVLKNGRTI